MNFEELHAPTLPLYKKYDKKALEYIFENKNASTAYGMFLEGEMLAWCSYKMGYNDYSLRTDSCEISSIVVSTKFRRRGLGYTLLSHMITDLRKSRERNIYLTVSPENTIAIIFYLKYGFRIIDYKKDYYGQGVDRVFLKFQDCY